MELLVGQSHFIPGLTFPDQGSFIPVGSSQMSVKAVFGDVQFTADEPLCERLLPFENCLPLFLPQEKLLGLLGPEFLGVFYRFAI